MIFKKICTLSIVALMTLNITLFSQNVQIDNNSLTNSNLNTFAQNTQDINIKIISSEEDLKNYLIINLLSRKKIIECTVYADDVYLDIDSLDNIINEINSENKFIKSMVNQYHFQTIDYGNKSEFKIEIDYLTESEKFSELNTYIDAVLSEIIEDDMLDYEKVLMIHDFIVKSYKYDLTYNNYSPYSLYKDGEGVCQAYSLMFYYMVDKLNIPVRMADGYVNGEVKDLHGWNQVNLGGYWFNVDTTWDDPVPDVEGEISSHDYFCITDAKISEDHTFTDKEYTETCTKEYSDYLAELNKVKDSLITERTTNYINIKIHDSYIDFAAVEEGTDRIAITPIVENNRTLVPIRSVASKLNFEVSWNQEEGMAYLTKGDNIIKIKPGEKIIYVNGIKTEIDVPAKVMSERILIPVRAISENFDYIVYWVQDTKDILIY